jgi:hypothetical protein
VTPLQALLRKDEPARVASCGKHRSAFGFLREARREGPQRVNKRPLPTPLGFSCECLEAGRHQALPGQELPLIDSPYVCRVEMWRGGRRCEGSVAAPFVWRCPSTRSIAPFPHPAHRTGRAALPHPALGQDLTPSPTAGHCPTQSDARVRSARRGARVDRSRLRDGASCVWCVTTGAPAWRCSCRAHGRRAGRSLH